MCLSSLHAMSPFPHVSFGEKYGVSQLFLKQSLYVELNKPQASLPTLQAFHWKHLHRKRQCICVHTCAPSSRLSEPPWSPPQHAQHGPLPPCIVAPACVLPYLHMRTVMGFIHTAACVCTLPFSLPPPFQLQKHHNFRPMLRTREPLPCGSCPGERVAHFSPQACACMRIHFCRVPRQE